MGISQVQFVIDSRSVGEGIVEALLVRRLAACAQTIGPISSRYWWDGQIQDATEWLFVCKTTQADKAIDAIKALHPYDTPEIIATDVDAAFAGYVEWVQAECGTSG